jgi:allantoicase
MENLLKPGRGIFIADKYTDRGKWMDGWESRRSYGRDNSREHDWCEIALGVPGVIRGFDVDTNHFKGNAPQSVSIEASAGDNSLTDDTSWVTLLPPTDVAPDSQNLFEIDNDHVWTHVRLNMYPDGGIARLRVFGDATVNRELFQPEELIDLAAILNGGKAVLCSDMFFSDKNNLLLPGRGINMGDGWETKRRRDPGPDWSIIKLAFEGTIQKILVDTAHFKGNYPDRFSLQGAKTDDASVADHRVRWEEILPETRLQADHEHLFVDEIISPHKHTFTHVRLNIFPDGGISRLRVFGYIAATANNDVRSMTNINNLPEDQLLETLKQCCTSAKWVNAMALAVPFSDAAHLVSCADDCWLNLEEADYLEAFAGHPKIGNLASLREKYKSTQTFASKEQSGIDDTDETTLMALFEGNVKYEKKFGFIFIVCATGKSATQMLELLRARLLLDRATELKNAIEEQRKIFQIRLEQLV